MIGCRGGKQCQRDLFASNTRIVQRLVSGHGRKPAQGLATARPIARPDSRAAFDPARFQTELLFDLTVFHAAFGHRMTETGHAGGAAKVHCGCPVTMDATSSIAS